jgi:8-oxo-dGTP pyrophosphatase MutT (NUDIX family)
MSAVPDWLHTLVESARGLTTADLSPVGPPAADRARRSAVLILFGEAALGPDLVLTERAHSLRSHAGQVAFPGGAADGDESALQTALREAREEIGLDPAGVQVLGELPPLGLPRSRFAVTGVLAWWRTESPIGVADHKEVAAVLRVPLSELADPQRRVTVAHPAGYRGPGFLLGELVLWGFTANIVDRLLSIAGLHQPWDADRTVPAPAVVRVSQ